MPARAGAWPCGACVAQAHTGAGAGGAQRGAGRYRGHLAAGPEELARLGSEAHVGRPVPQGGGGRAKLGWERGPMDRQVHWGATENQY